MWCVPCIVRPFSLYYKLVEEMRDLQAQGERGSEWISWHEGAHLISKKPQGSKTFQMIQDRMCDYFGIREGSRGTRFNWYKDSSDWKVRAACSSLSAFASLNAGVLFSFDLCAIVFSLRFLPVAVSVSTARALTTTSHSTTTRQASSRV